jgi:hypothetical protein
VNAGTGGLQEAGRPADGGEMLIPLRTHLRRRLIAGATLVLAVPAGLLAAPEALAAPPRPKPVLPFLVFVREAKQGAQPTHAVAARSPIELGFVRGATRARVYSVCIRGKDHRRCWRRKLGTYADPANVRTSAPARAGRYVVTWKAGTKRASWRLRVVAKRR